MQINERFALEANLYCPDSFNIIDTYKSYRIGTLWPMQVKGVWGFQLSNGKERVGSYSALLGSLKRMLRVESAALPKFSL